jgi:site-specific recombinase XerD
MNSKERNHFIKKAKRQNNVTQSAYYQTFTAYLQSKNILPKSVERYALLIERYKKWLLEHKDITLDNAEKKDLLDYLQYLQEKRNLAGRTRQQVL